jgi:hypothetical protein
MTSRQATATAPAARNESKCFTRVPAASSPHLLGLGAHASNPCTSIMSLRSMPAIIASPIWPAPMKATRLPRNMAGCLNAQALLGKDGANVYCRSRTPHQARHLAALEATQTPFSRNTRISSALQESAELVGHNDDSAKHDAHNQGEQDGR